MNTTQNSTKSKIVKVIGVDLAKDHCDVIGYDENGKICLRLDGCSYAKLREILSNLPQAVVLMEACKGSMFHARSIADLGHEVRLVKGADVKALRNINHKNDLRDAADLARKSNRYQKLLNSAGCRTSTVFSDVVHGRASSRILDAFLHDSPDFPASLPEKPNACAKPLRKASSMH